MTDEREDDDLTELEQQLEANARERDRRIDELQREAAARPRTITMDLEEMLERFAYLHNEDRVVDLERPWITYSRQGFKNATAASTRVMVGPRGGERLVAIADDWLQHDGRVDLEATTFRPGAARLTKDLAGRDAVNMWSAPKILERALPEDWKMRANIFHSHMNYLIPNATERSNIVRWLAQRIQRPEQLPGWHILLVAESVQGTGRNWIARLLKSILVEYVVEALPLKRILDGSFNSELDRALIGVVDEIREGGSDYWKHAEEMKSFLSEKTRVINKKYRAPYEIQNYLGVMMFSNHIDALPIDQYDRRFYVAMCTTAPKDSDYFDLIYDALKDPLTLRSIYETLMQIDLRGFVIEGRAPLSDVKREMIAESRSDEEAELLRLIAEWPSDVMRSATLRQKLQAFRDNDLMFGEDRHKSDQLSTGQLRRLYRVCGVKSIGKVRMIHVDEVGRRTETYFRVVALRNYRERWKAAGETEVRGEVERGEAEMDARVAAEKGQTTSAAH